MKKENRILGIDLVKVLAVILVITVHFFKNTQFYDVPYIGINLKIQMIIKNICMICVPLFMTATGYLNKEMDYNKKFFKKLGNILIVWLFYSTIEFVVWKVLNNDYLGLSIKNYVFELFSFKACSNSWYIEFYIGLYLLSPMFNMAFEHFSRKNRIIVTIMTIVLCTFPNFINNVFENAFHFPYYWVLSYVLAYYFTGKLINYEQPHFKKRVILLLYIFSQIILFLYSISFETTGYDLFVIFVPTILVFLFLYDINIKVSWIRKVFIFLSTISLDIYLASSLIDKLVYGWFKSHYYPMEQTKVILYAPIILITIFLISTTYGSIRKALIKVR